MAALDPDARIAAHTSPRRATLELVVIGLGALVVSLSQSVLVPVLSILPARLDTSASNVSWLLTSTLLVAAVAVPIIGRLGDMFGKRLMLLVAVGALIVGSLVTALTDDIGLLIVGRAVQGASAAAIPLGISLLGGAACRGSGSAPPIALISAMLGVGGALGLPLAGFVAEHADFHALFWITAVGGPGRVRRHPLDRPRVPGRSGGRVDLVGAALLAAGLVCLLLPLAQSSAWGWDDPRVLGLLVALRRPGRGLRLEPAADPRPARGPHGAAPQADRADQPRLARCSASRCSPRSSAPRRSSRRRRPAATASAPSCSSAASRMLPSGLAMLLLSPVAARLIEPRGAPQTLALGATVVAAGWLMRIVVTDSLWQVVVGATIVGIGTGIGYAAIPSLINGTPRPTRSRRPTGSTACSAASAARWPAPSAAASSPRTP